MKTPMKFGWLDFFKKNKDETHVTPKYIVTKWERDMTLSNYVPSFYFETYEDARDFLKSKEKDNYPMRYTISKIEFIVQSHMQIVPLSVFEGEV